jgi:hypothetical protein
MTNRTNGSATATVETLTAEVRTLIVGSRQITMSVFKQLDYEDFSKIEPMGRVRVAAKDSDSAEGVDIVGRSTKSGTLVRSFVRKPSWYSRPDLAAEAWFHWVEHQHRDARRPHRLNVLTAGDHTLSWPAVPCDNRWYCTSRRDTSRDPDQIKTINRDDYPDNAAYHQAHADADASNNHLYDTVNWLDAEHRARWLLGEFCGLDDLRAQWQIEANHQAAELKAQQKLYDDAAALPLIVLAGLR